MKKFFIISLCIMLLFSQSICFSKTVELIGNDNANNLNIAEQSLDNVGESLSQGIIHLNIDSILKQPILLVWIFIKAALLIVAIDLLTTIVVNIVYKNKNTLTDIKSRNNLDKIFKSLEHV